MKKLTTILLLMVSLIILISCQTNQTSPYGDILNQSTTQITHYVNTSGNANTEITEEFKTNPRNVAVFTYETIDMLDYVGIKDTGIQKLGLPKSNLPSSLSKFNDSNFINIGTLFEPDYNALDLFLPDLIIIGGRSASLYDTLKSTYPNCDILDVSNSTFSFANLERNSINLSKIFANVKQRFTAKYQELSDTLALLKETTKDKEALFIMLNGEDLSFFGENSRYGTIYSDFGFSFPESSAIPPSSSEIESHGNQVSYEYISAVNPQIILILDRASALDGASSIDTFYNNALIRNTNAFKNDQIYLLDAESWYLVSGGFNSTLIMIDDINQINQGHKGNNDPDFTLIITIVFASIILVGAASYLIKIQRKKKNNLSN